MQATATITQKKRRRKQTAVLLVIGVLLIAIGLIALFSLSGKAVRFDKAYDEGKDLSQFYFEKLQEGESYTSLQSLWLTTVRHRTVPMLLGLAFIAAFILLNRDLLYSQKIAPWVFISPFVITFLVFFLYPLISTILMSFQSIKATGSEWIGLKNYTDMFSNKTFFIAVKNSMRYMVITCAILIPVPLLLAYMLNSKTMKFAGVFKTISFMPVLCSVVVAGIIFRMMFSELDGALMNQVAVFFGSKPIKWLKGEWTAMFAMVLLCCWRWTGMNILYYMAGLKSIPGDLYEAADIDGANEFQKFWHVILQLIQASEIYVLTIFIYTGVTMFTESYMVFGNNN